MGLGGQYPVVFGVMLLQLHNLLQVCHARGTIYIQCNWASYSEAQDDPDFRKRKGLGSGER